MASHNSVRTNVRSFSYLHKNLRVSLQTLSAEESLVKIEHAIEKSTKENNKLRGVKQVLLDLLTCGCLDFDFGFELFSAHFNGRPQRQYFRDSLTDETFGIPVLIYRGMVKSGQQQIILKDGSVSLENIFLHLVEDEEEQQQHQECEDVSAELINRAIDSMVNEYDRNVTKALLSAVKRDTLFGMSSTRATKLLTDLERRLEAWEACKSEAEELVVQRLDDRIASFRTRIDAVTENIQAVTGRWPPERVGDLDNERAFLQQSLEHVKKLKLKETPYTKQCFRQAVKRKANQIADDQLIKKRARGAGPKTLMDAEDEIWLAKCIEDKTTVHGRRHESVLYTHHRVKNQDLLRLANYRREGKGLPLIRAVSTVTSRARPTRMASMQSKRHKGQGLWCSKKPPKTEERDNECTHHQRKHVALAKEHLFGVEAGERRKYGLAISMDDKAYLRPGTSEGFSGSRHQSVLQPTDEHLARRLPTHDFPEPSMYITPSAFRVLKKQPSEMESSTLISSEDSSMAVIHPKAYIGTHGTTWASNYMRLRRDSPVEFEVPSSSTVHQEIRKLFCRNRDATKYFLDTAMKADVLCVSMKADCPFRSYTSLQLESFKAQLKQGTHDWLQVKDSLSAADIALGTDVVNHVSVVVSAVESAVTALSSSSGKKMWSCYQPIIQSCHTLLKLQDSTPMPTTCPHIIELTDAGPGVGVSNFEVRFRAAERVRIHSTDLLCRIHRAREDSGQNEAERLNASMGEAICDGGAIQWQTFSATHGLSGTDISTMTVSDLAEHAEQMMEKNAWAATEEIRLRIDKSPAPSGFTRAFTVEKQEDHFFYNRKYLLQYMGANKLQRAAVPGHGYFQKIECFFETHFEIGELYMEYLKGSCNVSGGAHCDFCTSHPISGPPIARIPRPYPDHQRLPELKYRPYNKTPIADRLPDDFQPRAQLKKAFERLEVLLDNPVSISEFSQKYVVAERSVCEYVQHIEHIKMMKTKRSAEKQDRKGQAEVNSYDDYDWEDLYRQDQLSKLRVSELDKYLSKHALQQHGKKSVKLEIVRAHIGKRVCSNVLSGLAATVADDSSSESESESHFSAEESEDEVILEIDSDIATIVTSNTTENNTAVNEVSRFGRVRKRVDNPDYYFYKS